MNDFWRQQKNEPLFPDLIWSRPQTKRTAGKLLVIGGQQGQFTHVSNIYSAVQEAGAGHIRVLLPESLRRVTQHLPDIEYAPSNPSGSFAKSALGMMNEMSEWADAALLAGDFGKNSETSTILDGYLLRCPLPVTIAEDAFHSVALPTRQLLTRPITLVLEGSSVQKIPAELELAKPITSNMNIASLAEVLGKITEGVSGELVTTYQSNLWVSANGNVISTSTNGNLVNIQRLTAYAAVWRLQQSKKPLEALATACWEVASK